MNNEEYKKEMEREMLLNIEIEKHMLKAPTKQTRKIIPVSKNPHDVYYQKEMEREYLLNIQIENELYASLPKQNISKQFISPLTQEMMDDYKKQFKRPGYLFNFPSNLKPELEVVRTDERGRVFAGKNELDVEFTETQLKDKMDQIEQYTNDITNYERKTIPSIINEILIKKFEYNNIAESYNPIVMLDAKKIDEDIKRLNKQIEDIKEMFIPRLNGLINTLNQEISENNMNIESNKAKIINMEYNNKRKIKEYTETARLLTNGFNMLQLEGESEQDFLNRISTIGEIPDDPTESKLYNITVFKKNMMTILNQDWLIENIIKSLDIANIFYINFVFPKFKKYFIDTFGINNKVIELDDYIGIINDFIEKNENEDKPKTEKQDTFVFYDQSQYYNYTQPPPEPPEIFYDADANAEIEAKVDADIAEKQAEMEFNKNPIPDSSFKKMNPEYSKKIEEFKKAQEDELNVLSEKKFKKLEPPQKRKKTIKRANELNLKNVEDFDAPAPAPAPASSSSSTPPTITMPNFKDTRVDVLYDGDTKIIQFTDKNLKRIYLMPYLKVTKSGEVRKTNFKGVKYSYNNTDFADLNPQSGSQNFGSNIKIALGKPPTAKVPSKLEYKNEVGFNMGEDDRQLFLNKIKASDGNERPALLHDVLMSYQDGRGIKGKKQKKKPIVQKGKSLKDVPSHCEFGKLILLLKKLYQTNMLSVKDKNNINVQGIPNQKVSNDFVNILMKICTNKKVNKKDINNLNQKETILYNILLSKAGLSKDYDSDIKNTVKNIKNRLQLIEGQIQAGNNNNDLKKELYSIIFQLANIGAISISSARKYYNDTVKTYF